MTLHKHKHTEACPALSARYVQALKTGVSYVYFGGGYSVHSFQMATEGTRLATAGARPFSDGILSEPTNSMSEISWVLEA